MNTADSVRAIWEQSQPASTTIDPTDNPLESAAVPERNRASHIRSIRAGELVDTILQSTGTTIRSFARTCGVSESTLRNFCKSGANEESYIPPAFRTEVRIVNGLRALKQELADHAPSAAELLSESIATVCTLLLPDEPTIADYFLRRLELESGTNPVGKSTIYTLRSGDKITPGLGELVSFTDTCGLIPANLKGTPWEAPMVQEAERVWLYESIEILNRPESVTHAMAMIQLAGFDTTIDGLQELNRQAQQLGITLPEDTSLNLSYDNARKFGSFEMIPYSCVQDLLLIAAEKIGRSDRVAELRDAWQQEAHAESLNDRVHDKLRRSFEEQQWKTRELTEILGFEVNEFTTRHVRNALDGRAINAPLRGLIVALAESVQEARALDRDKATELLMRNQLRGRRNPLTEGTLARRLWGLSVAEANPEDKKIAPAAIQPEHIQRIGDQKAHEILSRWLDRRQLSSARAVVAGLCMRYENYGGNGTAKLAKEVGAGRNFFEESLTGASILPVHLLRQTLQVMEGIESIPPALESKHRLDTGDYLATRHERASSVPALRFLTALVQERHSSPKGFYTELGLSSHQRRVLASLVASPEKAITEKELMQSYIESFAALSTPALRADVARFGAVLLEQDGNFAATVTAITKEFLRGDSNQRRIANAILDLLYEPDLHAITPEYPPTDPTALSTAQLFQIKERAMLEYTGRAWDSSDTHFPRERRYAVALRYLPGVSRVDLEQASSLLSVECSARRAEVLVSQIDSPEWRGQGELLSIIASMAEPHSLSEALSRLNLDISQYERLKAESPASTEGTLPECSRLRSSDAEPLFPLSYAVQKESTDIETDAHETFAGDGEAVTAVLLQQWQAREIQIEALLARIQQEQTRTPVAPKTVGISSATRELMYQLLDTLQPESDYPTFCQENNIPESVLERWQTMRAERSQPEAPAAAQEEIKETGILPDTGSAAPTAAITEGIETGELRKALAAAEQRNAEYERSLHFTRYLPENLIVAGGFFTVRPDRKPTEALLDILSLPVIDATAFLEVYSRLPESLRFDATGNSAVSEPLLYIQQHCVQIVNRTRTGVGERVDKLREGLKQLRPDWRPEPTAGIAPLPASTNEQQIPSMSAEQIPSATSGASHDHEVLRARHELSRLKDEIESLRFEQEQISSQVQGLEAERTSLLLAIRSLEVENRQRSDEVTEKRSGLNQLQRQISEAKEQLEQIVQQNNKQAAEVKRAEPPSAPTMPAASQQSPERIVLNNDPNPGDPINLTTFKHHTDDVEQYPYDREPRLFGIGEYMEGYSAPDQAGVTLREPASISIARAAATRQIEAPQDILDLSLLLFYSFGHAPGHEGARTLIARLEQLRADDATAALVNTAMEVLWQHPRARSVMTGITRLCSGSETDTFIRSFIPKSELVFESVLSTEELDEELPWPVMPEPS